VRPWPFHVNSDWIIVEPIDEQGNPVPDGTPSDGVLVTNMANLVQPVIRYRMSDTLTMHSAPCGCGLPFPYIEMNGRSEEVFEFRTKEHTARIAARCRTSPRSTFRAVNLHR
jgi:phenylacetate-coenzyme A ligase PaaK-like adenylate-forming protein